MKSGPSTRPDLDDGGRAATETFRARTPQRPALVGVGGLSVAQDCAQAAELAVAMHGMKL